MAPPRVSLSAVALSAITGMTLAAVSLLTYARFEHPQEFADASIRMVHPEFAPDEFSKKWGMFGTGLIDSVPEGVKNFFVPADFAERVELQKKKRQEQIRQSIEDFRPKGK
ncbi:hypothetical protein BBJ28_00018528 [Nothophytophthora sp. Chile5]|nr:hypothetical protein BBJ28_00018528 [Nothophytophthora sp. Chile5]